MYEGKEIKGYRWNSKLYHPECLPANADTSRMYCTPIFRPEQLEGKRRCARCGTSLFPRQSKAVVLPQEEEETH